MPRLLSYSDAAKLLGGGNSQIVNALDQITAGVLLGAAPIVPAVLSLFDAKADFIRLSHQLVRAVREQRSGLSRYSRTQRLHAAHTVIVVTAFFEAVAASNVPYRFEDLELTREEQLKLTQPNGASPTPTALTAVSLVDLARDAEVPLPAPHESSEDFLARLAAFYLEYALRFHRFVGALAAGEALANAPNARLSRINEALPAAAQQRYGELIGQLSSDFPEVAWWLGTREHRATQAAVREVRSALAGVERLLATITTGQPPDQRRLGLSRAYQAALGRAITQSGDAPPGIRIPTLDEAYVEPLFRLARVESATLASDQGWWERQPVRDQLELCLTRYLTSPQATTAPLLVLGQPGSGKSVLTKLLAARLPAADFLPVRVALRDVPTHADLQDQIEFAIRDATGERLAWPDLARGAGDALPVVILDGFDELLQATGASQSDYLLNVARFQEREALQCRPVAVIVTSRTSVADRAQPPRDTTALRLEPFDEVRIAAWVNRWNTTNAGHFADSGLAPLSPAAVLAHRELASQPLLLLMLALYDAPGNALQRLTGALAESDLYERLLRDFCEREVTKHQHGLRPVELRRAVEDELRQLSVVSFGMFNRGTQWITEVDLDSDLTALVGQRPASHQSRMRTPLGQAETLLGRFFFIHRSQATRNENRLQTYEFLHATFGEYLVARFTWRVLLDTVARESASTLRLAAYPDDDLLHALLSFAAICARAPIIAFLRELIARDEPRREEIVDFLLRLHHMVHDQRPARAYAAYQPKPVGVPARHAAYSANLVVLGVCVAGTLRASDLYPATGDDPVDRWHSSALLWRSQLNGENWSRIVDTIRVDRFYQADRRDLVLSLDDGSFRAPPVDPNWTYFNDQSAAGPAPAATTWSHHHPDVLGRKAYFQCGNLDDVVHHALDPLAAALPDSVNTLIRWEDDSQFSVANLLLELWLSGVNGSSPAERVATYQKAARTLTVNSAATQTLYIRLLLRAMTSDSELSSGDGARLLQQILGLGWQVDDDIERDIEAFLLSQLCRDPQTDEIVESAAIFVAGCELQDLDRPVAEMLVRLLEVAPALVSDRPWQEVHDHLLSQGWPDLANRVDAAAQRSSLPSTRST